MVEEVLVFCHTIFNDAFRSYPDASKEKLKEQESAKFIIRYLIETRNDNLEILAITSEQVMEALEYSLPNQGIGDYPAKIVLAFKNLILTIDGKVQNLGESVTIISDLISSKIDGVKLISNMPKKKIDVINFYQKYESTSRHIKEQDIPFKIINACDIEDYLRKKNPEICKVIDKRVNNEL